MVKKAVKPKPVVSYLWKVKIKDKPAKYVATDNEDHDEAVDLVIQAIFGMTPTLSGFEPEYQVEKLEYIDQVWSLL